LAKGCALIRANFGIDAEHLSYEAWAKLFGQAVWLERERLTNMAKMLAKVFGGV